MPPNNDIVNSIIAFGAALSDAREAGPDGNPHVVIPADYKVQGLEAQLPRPTRMRGTVALQDLDSFNEYIKRAQSDDWETTLYTDSADSKGLVCTAIFNDAPKPAGQRGWQDWRATYTVVHSQEWIKWKVGMKANSQDLFARFIEDNLPDIVDPPGATMLQLARTFEAKKKVEFASSIRIENGDTALHYQEVTTAGSTDPVKGVIQIPDAFTIAIPVFEYDAAYSVRCRLRYRVEGGKLAIWYDFEREHKIVEDAIEQMRKKVGDLTGLKSLRGAPPVPIAPIPYK